MDNTGHQLSVMVVAFNEAPHLPRTKEALDAVVRPDGVTVETILVDGGSRDGTPDVARRAEFDKVVELPGASIPRCRNEGIRRARGDWLAFVDADCEVAPDWLEQAAPFLRRGTPTLLGWPVRPPEPGTRVQTAWHVHWTHKNVHREDVEGRQVVRQDAFRLITTRNMLLTRTAADATGEFDEGLPTGEDTDFVFRAYLKDVDVLAVPALQVIHHGEPATLKEFYRQQLWHANRASYQLIMQRTGGRVGGNAPLFAGLFLASGFLALAGVMLAVVLACPYWLLLALPLAGLVAGPALLISVRKKSPKYFVALCALYTAYGLARALNLLGLFQAKPSWKS